MDRATRRLVLALALAPAAACGRGGSGGDTPFTAKGTVQVDGQPRTVTRCALDGSGVDQRLTLTLDDGTAITMPVHEARTTVARPGKPPADATDCARNATSTAGSGAHLAGTFGRSCTGDGFTLELDLELSCGTPGPSNRRPE